MSKALRILLAALAALALAAGTIACGDDDDEGGGSGGGGGGDTGAESSVEVIEKNPANEGKAITVGSKNFTEQFILGEIYSQALEAAGFQVKKELNLGSEQIAFKALKSGQIDAYPEYTGTSLTSFFDLKTDEVPKDPNEAYELTKENYAKEGITALPITSFEDTFRVATTKEKQAGLLKGATKLSELDPAAPLRITGFPECRQRTDCLLGIQDTYGLDNLKFVSTEQKYEPLNNDQTDLGFVFSTDGELTLDKYAIIEDDKGLFPPYNISFGIKNEKLEEIGPEGQEIIERVQKPLTEEIMQELNSRVDLDKQEPAAVAGDYLKESGFVK